MKTINGLRISKEHASNRVHIDKESRLLLFGLCHFRPNGDFVNGSCPKIER